MKLHTPRQSKEVTCTYARSQSILMRKMKCTGNPRISAKMPRPPVVPLNPAKCAGFAPPRDRLLHTQTRDDDHCVHGRDIRLSAASHDGSETIKLNPGLQNTSPREHIPATRETTERDKKREPPETANRTPPTSPSRSRYAPQLELALALGFSATMATGFLCNNGAGKRSEETSERETTRWKAKVYRQS